MEGTPLTRLQKKRLLRASAKLKTTVRAESKPNDPKYLSTQSADDGIIHKPTENNPRGKTILSPVTNATSTLLAPVCTNDTRRERHIQLLMAQTGAGHDIAARCLDNAGGDIAGAIMKIFDTSTSAAPSPVLLAPIQQSQNRLNDPFSYAPKSASPYVYGAGAAANSARGRFGLQAKSSWENSKTNRLSSTIGAANTGVRETSKMQRFCSVVVNGC